MDAAKELTGTYLQRVLRRWAGKGPAVNNKISSARSSPAKASNQAADQRLLATDSKARRRATGVPCEVAAEIGSVEKSKAGGNLLHAQAGVTQCAACFQHDPALQQLQCGGASQALAQCVEMTGRQPKLIGIAGNRPVGAIVLVDQALIGAQMAQRRVRVRADCCGMPGALQCRTRHPDDQLRRCGLRCDVVADRRRAWSCAMLPNNTSSHLRAGWACTTAGAAMTCCSNGAAFSAVLTSGMHMVMTWPRTAGSKAKPCTQSGGSQTTQAPGRRCVRPSSCSVAGPRCT